MYTYMYIFTHMQFGPVMSPRLPLRVRLLPGHFFNRPRPAVPGRFDNARNFVRSTYEMLLCVVLYMNFCCGSFSMMFRAGERYTYMLM